MTSLMKLTPAGPLSAAEAGNPGSASHASKQHSHKGKTALARVMGVLKATLVMIQNPALC
jgi:hypothetical protein